MSGFTQIDDKHHKGRRMKKPGGKTKDKFRRHLNWKPETKTLLLRKSMLKTKTRGGGGGIVFLEERKASGEGKAKA